MVSVMLQLHYQRPNTPHNILRHIHIKSQLNRDRRGKEEKEEEKAKEKEESRAR